MWTRDVFARGKIRGTAFFLLRLLKQHTWNLASRGRRKHLDQGDMVAFPMPAAVKSIQDREWLYGKSIVRKLALIPNPISSTCRYAGEKRNIIMAVGRWDDLLYKRPFLLMATLEQALPRAPHWEAEIYGNIPPLLREWHGNLPGRPPRPHPPGRLPAQRGAAKEILPSQNQPLHLPVRGNARRLRGSALRRGFRRWSAPYATAELPAMVRFP